MMRPDSVFACIEFGAEHATYMERQMDEQADETARVAKEALKVCSSIISFSLGSNHGQKQPRYAREA